MGILFVRGTKIDVAFDDWREEIKKSGESVLSKVLQKRYDDLVATRDKLISGGQGPQLALAPFSAITIA